MRTGQIIEYKGWDSNGCSSFRKRTNQKATPESLAKDWFKQFDDEFHIAFPGDTKFSQLVNIKTSTH